MEGLVFDWNLSAAAATVVLGLTILIYFLLRMLTHRHEEHGPRPEGKKGRKSRKKGAGGKRD